MSDRPLLPASDDAGELDETLHPQEGSCHPLPDFIPVPRRRDRHDGWTAERQRGFIEALADTGSVRAAAHAVNMAPEGAYMLRRHPQAESFCKAWEAALRLGVQRLEDIALERAIHGVEVPVYSYGKLVGTRRAYNDRLLMFMLRSRAPTRFRGHAARGLDAASRSTLERQKRQWRKEWEAKLKAKKEAEERARRAETREETEDRLEKLVASAHATWVREMTEETLTYYVAFVCAKRAQAAGTTLKELGLDPFSPGFDAKAIPLPPPDESGRELIRELGTP